MKASQERFLSLLRAQQGGLFRLARTIVGQEQDAWDIVQETTLAAYRSFSRFDGGPDKFGPWIRRILVNQCRDLLRARNRLLLLEPGADIGAADPDPGPEQCLDHALLWGEVTSLEEHHRQVLTLRFFVDMSVDEIAKLLDVPAGTVKSRLHRALRALRQRLEAELKGEVKGHEPGAATQVHR